MNPRHHIVVIGRGIAGLCAAMRLAEAGARVTLIGAQLPEAASPAATGVVALKGLILPETPLFACKLRGRQGLAALINQVSQRSAVEVPHSFTGAYELFADAGEYKALGQRVFHRQFTGCFAVQRLSARALAARAGGDFFAAYAAEKALRGGFYYDGDGWFHPRAFLRALEGSVQAYGGKLVDDLVHRLSRGEGDGGLQVHGERASYPASAVVVACGANTNNLLTASALPPLPLTATPGQTLYGRLHPAATHPDPVLVVKRGRASLALAGAELYLGAYDHAKNTAVTPRAQASAHSSLQADLAALTPAALRSQGHSWEARTGVRVMAHDRQPILGFWPAPGQQFGVWLMTGFHKSGFYLADTFAQSLCQQLLGRPPLPLTASFTTQRFFA